MFLKELEPLAEHPPGNPPSRVGFTGTRCFHPSLPAKFEVALIECNCSLSTLSQLVLRHSRKPSLEVMQDCQSLIASRLDLDCGHCEFVEITITNPISVAACQQFVFVLFYNTNESTDCSCVPAHNLPEPLLCFLCHRIPVDGGFDRDCDTLGLSHRFSPSLYKILTYSSQLSSLPFLLRRDVLNSYYCVHGAI
jgi:hypothetical protein